MAEPTPSPSRSPAVAFAEWLPALGGSRLLRVHGEAAAEAPPMLLLVADGTEHRIEPRTQSRFTRPNEWRASYLIPSELAHASLGTPALEWPDGTRLQLPQPPSEPRAEVIEPSVLTSLRARRAGTPAPQPAPAPAPGPTNSSPAPQASPPATGLAAPAPADGVAAAASADGVAAAAFADGVAAAPSAGAAASPPAWTDLPAAFSRTVFEPEALWTAKRAELERELGRAAEAISRARAGERESRDAMLVALADLRADLRAARAAREADASVIAVLTAQLEAERVALAVARQTAAALRTALAEARAAAAPDASAAAPPEPDSGAPASAAPPDGDAAPGGPVAAPHGEAAAVPPDAAAAPSGPVAAPDAEPATVPPDAAAAPSNPVTPAPAPAREATPRDRAAALDAEAAASAPLLARIEELGRSSGRDALARVAREHGGVDPRPGQETGELVANLDAAAAALRARTGPPARPLRHVLVDLAEHDPATAAKLLVALLPAQGRVLDAPIAYDLTIAGAGTYAITVADGEADVQRVSKRRSRRKAAFELRADALTLAKLLAGEELKLRRYRGEARVTRRRRRARALQTLPAAQLSLAEAVAAGAVLEPALVYRALPYAIAPEWTAGHTFTIAQEISGPPARTWYVVVADGAPIEVTHEPRPADATVTMTRAAFDRLLRDEPPAPGERPLVNGDRAAVALLKEWTDRARGSA